MSHVATIENRLSECLAPCGWIVRAGEQIFFVDKADYQQFIDLLQETAELFNVNVAAFCLMPRHYHLMVQTPDANLSRCMRHLNGVYTQKYNMVHGSDGTLFRGRYKSILVDADSYSEVNRYYETRPAALTAVRRGIENEPRDVAIYLIRNMRSEPLLRIGAQSGY